MVPGTWAVFVKGYPSASPLFSAVVQAATSRDGSVLFFWLQMFNTCISAALGAFAHGRAEQGLENPVPVLAPAGHGWFPWLRERAAKSWQGCFFIQCLLAARAETIDCPEQVGEDPGTLSLPWALEEFKALCCWRTLVLGNLKLSWPGPGRRGLTSCLAGSHATEKSLG